MLGGRLQNIDAVIEVVPDLLSPSQVLLSLSNLKRWFPAQDPFQLLQTNPALLNNVEEADVDADPLYGEWVAAVAAAGGIPRESGATPMLLKQVELVG